MAPLPVESTQRFVFDYESGGNGHSIMVRTADSVTPAEAGAALDAFLSALEPNLFAMSITSAVQYLTGSTVSFPVTTGIEGNSYGTGVPSVLEEPQYIDFVGRTTGGRRVRITVFSPSDLGGNFRVSEGEFASIAAALAVLEGSTGIFIGVDGLDPFWKRYANTGLNSYWERQQRA